MPHEVPLSETVGSEIGCLINPLNIESSHAPLHTHGVLLPPAPPPAVFRSAQLTARSLCGRRSLARSSRTPSVLRQRGGVRRCSCPQRR